VSASSTGFPAAAAPAGRGQQTAAEEICHSNTMLVSLRTDEARGWFPPTAARAAEAPGLPSGHGPSLPWQPREDVARRRAVSQRDKTDATSRCARLKSAQFSAADILGASGNCVFRQKLASNTCASAGRIGAQRGFDGFAPVEPAHWTVQRVIVEMRSKPDGAVDFRDPR